MHPPQRHNSQDRSLASLGLPCAPTLCGAVGLCSAVANHPPRAESATAHQALDPVSGELSSTLGPGPPAPQHQGPVAITQSSRHPPTPPSPFKWQVPPLPPPRRIALVQLAPPGRGSVHRRGLVTPRAFCRLGEGRLLVALMADVGVAGVGSRHLWGGVDIALSKVLHPHFIPLVSEGDQEALERGEASGMPQGAERRRARLHRGFAHPGEDGEEAEGDGSTGRVGPNAHFLSPCPGPLVGQETKANEPQERPETCRMKVA